MRNLLITEAAKANNNLLSELEKNGWVATLHQKEKDLVQNPENFDAVICNALFLYNDIKEFTNLHTIQLTSAGLDRVPLEYITQKHIKLFNARGVYSIPMAEWVVGVILNHYKNINKFHEQQVKHEWTKIRNLQELQGKHVAIIGAGNIGSEVAKRLQVFGTNIMGYDIKTYDNPYFNGIDEIQKFRADEFDIVILTAPHTAQTHHLFDKDVLEEFKQGSLLINMSRGGLINENDLVTTLTERKDITAILDVFEDEPLSMGSKMWDMPNIQIFPHNSFVGVNNDKRLHDVILKNLTSK